MCSVSSADPTTGVVCLMPFSRVRCSSHKYVLRARIVSMTFTAEVRSCVRVDQGYAGTCLSIDTRLSSTRCSTADRADFRSKSLLQKYRDKSVDFGRCYLKTSPIHVWRKVSGATSRFGTRSDYRRGPRIRLGIRKPSRTAVRGGKEETRGQTRWRQTRTTTNR